jgi:tRNA threonylcarbamoyladenosine biosynthesis protein TsaB
MIRVAIETATPAGSVAVARGERVLAEVDLGDQRRHAESVLPALEAVLSRAGLGRGDIEEVVVGAGPGSFTGVRVAAATAKGLVAALAVPLVAYPSLLALAAAVPSDQPVCALFDARRGEVYAGAWHVTADRIHTLLAPMVGPLVEVVDASRSWSRPPLFAGDGAGDLASADCLPTYPRASTLLWLAAHHREGAEVEDVAAWEPLYVRGSSAERGVAG